MSLLDNESEYILITRGEKAEIDIYLEKDTLPRAVDLTNFDQFKACFRTISGTPLVLTQVANANGSLIEKVAPDLQGHLKITIFPTDTLLLEATSSADEDIEIEYDNSVTPNKKKKVLHRVLRVDDTICD